MIEIVENNELERSKFSEKGWGHCGDIELTPEQLSALLNGKCLGVFDGEHTFIIMAPKQY